MGKGRALLPHLDSISSVTCRAASKPRRSPSARRDIPSAHGGSWSLHPAVGAPRAPATASARQHLAPHPGSLRAQEQRGLRRGGRAVPGLGHLQKSGSTGPAAQGGLGSSAGAAAVSQNLPNAPAEPRHWGAISAGGATLVRGAAGGGSAPQILLDVRSTKVQGDARTEAATATEHPDGPSLTPRHTRAPLKWVTLGHTFEKY